jgi:hypothetical protein
MTMPEEEQVLVRIHDLVTKHLERRATAADRDALDRLVQESAPAGRVFARYMQDTAHLRWWSGTPPADQPHGPGFVTSRSRSPSGWMAGIGGAVLATAVIAAGVLMTTPRAGMPPSTLPPSTLPPSTLPRAAGVATVTRLADVEWADGVEAWTYLARLAPGHVLRLDAGEVEIVFDIGVNVVIRGPALFEVRAGDRAYSGLGKINARVGKTGEGFVLETPNTRVVDLGTEFGVEVTAGGSTEVAVFRGLVDLSVSHPAPGTTTPPFRLRQGEALKVAANGSLDRVRSISSDRFPTPASDPARPSGNAPLIVDVYDNTDAESRKFYRIVRSGLHEDVPAFVDRDHQWNGVDAAGLPPFLHGIEYVMPYNDDKFIDQLAVAVKLDAPAVLYVFLSEGMAIPEWLSHDFVNTGYSIGLDEAASRTRPKRATANGPGNSIDTVFSVWRREIPEPTTVSLGAIARERRGRGYNMYGIAAAPLPGGPEALP